MKTIVPFSKEIKFNTKLYEILSISLEHELNVKEDTILGDFIISGEYRSHEISANKEKFFYRLPFSVEITDNIVKESVVFNIEDFNYEIKNDDILQIEIEFSVSALEEKKDEPAEIILPDISETNFDDHEERKKERLSDEIKIISEEEKSSETISTNSIIDKIKNNDSETYVAYHIYIIKETDTIETIANNFHINIDVLQNYNKNLNFIAGEKILVPYSEDE